MKRELSLYLDLVRFCCALLVFIGHASLTRLTGGLLWQTRKMGVDGVVVFFVLSGFVIAYVTSDREHDAETFTINRMARILSVAVPALIVTYFLDWHGYDLRPDLYPGLVEHGPNVIWQFGAGLLFINDLWFTSIPQGIDLPYWSLGFEIWYYVLWGVAIFTPGRWKVAAVILVALIVGPKILAMFPLWLLGVVCYRAIRHAQVRPVTGAVPFFGSLLLAMLWELWNIHHHRLTPVILHCPGLIQDYVTGAIFTLNMVGFVLWGRAGMFDRVARPIRWLAGGSFSLYLFHYPIMTFLAAEMSTPPTSWRTRLVVFVGTPLCALILAEVTERRKHRWRAGIAWLWNLLHRTIPHDRQRPCLQSARPP